jgi:SAM-dependent methyltransferase
MDLSKFATNIQFEEGIWYAQTRSAISYPEDANDYCFQLEDTSFWFQHRNRCIVEALRRFPPGDPFFDIGGGNGFVSAALQRIGCSVVLLEPGVQGARNARLRGIEHVICSSFEDAGLLPESMPSAGAFDVMEHIQDDVGLLRSIASRLAPGGRFYVAVPALPILWSQEDETAGHYRRYTTATLRSLLAQAGLDIEYLTYFFRMLPLPILFLRSIPHRIGIRRSDAALSDQYVTDHRPPSHFARALQMLQGRELALIRSGRTMIVGSSCLAVARKPKL